MSNDEQKEEIEVLQSIYPDEFQFITENSFSIKLALDPLPVDPGQDAEPPILLLHVTCPESYPSVAPDLDIAFDPDSPASSSLSFPEDKPQLLDALKETIEENMGMAMVFTLTSTLKEAAETLINDRAAKELQVREAELRREEEKEMDKFRGELVTKQRFIAWRAKFMAEREEEKRKVHEEEEAEGKRGQKSNPKAEERKLTGRDLWEKGLVGNVEDFEEDGGEESADVSKLKIGN